LLPPPPPPNKIPGYAIGDQITMIRNG